MALCSLRNLLPTACTLWSFMLATNGALSGETDQAKAEAQRFIQSQFAIRPDGSALLYDPPDPREPVGYGTGTSYWHLDGFRWQGKEESLTGADQLNDVTWKGSILVNIAAYRKARESS